jgi:dolichol-phosphate mannosyltransferase
MKQSWSIVVFCFNETGTVQEIIDRILQIFDHYRQGLYEIVVVDDGSTDGSYEKIMDAARARPDVIQVIHHEKNLGIGATLRDGYSAAQNENLTAIPADGQFDVRELIPYLDIDERTFVSFYRRENEEYSSFRMVLSTANKYVNHFLNGIELKDVNWVKIYKVREIKSFPWKLKSSLIESELCAKLLLKGDKAIEIVSFYYPRQSGKSKGASPRVVLQALLETVKLVWVIQHFKRRVGQKITIT